jgi:hypothetical protein
VLRHEQQIGYFLVDEIVTTLDVLFINIQPGSSSEKMLNLMRALNVLIGFQIMYRLEGPAS